MSTRFWLKAAMTAVAAFATGVAFSLYLKPGMLIEFSNLVLCY